MFDKIDEELERTALVKWLSSKNDFNEAVKLINDIRDDTNNVKPGSDDKKVFDDLEKMINDISNNKVENESVTERMKKSIDKLEQLRQKESTVFQNKLIYVLYYLFNLFGLGEKPLLFNEKNPDQLKLPKWIKVSKKRFKEILSIITKTKNDGLKTRVDGKEITPDNAERLLKDTANGKINSITFKGNYNNIVDDVDAILQKQMLTRSQEKMVNILLLLKEIPNPKDKEPDTTNMSELNSEESAKQSGKDLKNLTPSQMLSRLPITLNQLKAGNNSEKLKNEIRQLLYSLYHSKKLTKTIYNHLIHTI